MCHSIVWYYAFCQHLDEFQSSMIQCEHATVTGYDCLPYYQLILLLPLSGSCQTCIDEQRQQSEDADVDIGIEVLFDFDEELNKENLGCPSEDNTVLCALKSPVPIPGYHTHLYSPIEGNFEREIRWDLKEEVDISDYDDDDDLCPSPLFSNGGSSIFSKLDSEQDWPCQECAFPDSPTLNYDASPYDVSRQWGIAPNPYQEKTWQSRIPIPVSKNETKVQIEPEQIWDADELELFNQLTF
ncbi:hypothetical protein N7456_001962 [Penicillium angulare]|uniref:Uncharacterized protein n=1 Tax=Penicillium angulare TaxID=116970 RepID=A0A9W9KPV6_9EURO|nr:hypothetical protein N7456_001962 [Penicillium angulare]